MKKFIYVRMHQEYPTIFSTSPVVLDDILAQIKSKIPTAAIRLEQKNLDGTLAGFQMHQLQGKDKEVVLFMQKLLCENGFEPFEVSYQGEAHDFPAWIHFRKQEEE